MRVSKLALLKGDVHIWQADLDLPSSRIEKLKAILTDDEKTRAERFCFERDRDRFIAARGVLREILACYLSIPACHVRFCYGPHGKPRLGDTFRNRGITFNLSHSDKVAVYGFAQGSEIGVDIESIRSFPEMDDIVTEFFSAGEKEVLRQLSKSEKVEAFFRYWTRKEALVKAVGYGMSYPSNVLDVSAAADNSIEPVGIPVALGNPAEWTIQDLTWVNGFAGAFAVRGRWQRLSCWHWSGQRCTPIEDRHQ
jgi:4'-phosphopantetheinyl transferase